MKKMTYYTDATSDAFATSEYCGLAGTAIGTTFYNANYEIKKWEIKKWENCGTTSNITKWDLDFYNGDYECGTTSSTWGEWSLVKGSGDCWNWKTYKLQPFPLSPTEQLAKILKQRHSPVVHLNFKSRVVQLGDDREMRARDTLRMIIGEEKFQRFITRGFVTAYNPKSGYTYQIFHSRSHLTHVWKNGKMVQRLCIYLKGEFPPTDFVITMYLLAINNDDRIWEIGVKNPPLTQREERLVEEPRSLVEIFNELKAA